MRHEARLLAEAGELVAEAVDGLHRGDADDGLVGVVYSGGGDGEESVEGVLGHELREAACCEKRPADEEGVVGLVETGDDELVDEGVEVEV